MPRLDPEWFGTPGVNAPIFPTTPRRTHILASLPIPPTALPSVRLHPIPKQSPQKASAPVSYTHLTLPTILLV
eukprot:667135-Pleurochrysis_carterae.AAC.1